MTSTFNMTAGETELELKRRAIPVMTRYEYMARRGGLEFFCSVYTQAGELEARRLAVAKFHTMLKNVGAFEIVRLR